MYRCSRGGRSLFNRIEKIISTIRKGKVIIKDRTTTLSVINTDLKHKQISLSLVNARSIVNKIVPFHQYITEKDTDISIITETWIKMVDNPHTIKEIPPLGYKICSHPRRMNRKGGGLALVHKDSIIIKDVTDVSKSFTTMEHCNFNINFAGTVVHCHIIYRIPSTTVINFGGELTSIMEDTINLEQGRLLFVGNFNIHMDEPTQPDTITFLDWLESFNLTNRVTFGTHQSDHTLDLVITEQNENKNDYKQIYNIANSLLFRNEPSPIPPTNNLTELAEGFNSYFRDKIDKILINLKPTDASQMDSEYIESEYLTDIHLTKFSHIQVEDMTKMINTAPSKHCILDPIPTQLLRHHVIAIAPVIIGIYNSTVGPRDCVGQPEGGIAQTNDKEA